MTHTFNTTVEIVPPNAEHGTEWYPHALSKDAVLILIDREIAHLKTQVLHLERSRELVAAAPTGSVDR